MELRHLRYFVAVAEELNFTRAAARLNTAQPSFSQQIRDLEAEIGTPLLLRTKRRVELTDAGRVFLDEARLVLAQSQRAITLARRAAQMEARKLTIGFLPSAEVKIFPTMLSVMRTRLADLNPVFRSLTTAEQMEALSRREIDVGFVRLPVTDPALVWKTVLTERLAAVIPADHPLSTASAIDIRELAQTPFLRITPEQAGGLHEIVDTYLRDHQVEITPAQDVDNVITMMTLVGLGAGFALLPDYVAQLLFRNVTTRPLQKNAPNVELVMAWHRENDSPDLAAFRDLVCEVLNLPET
ncbi:LysR substrate-binding domain-containing protein [Xanthobacter sp. TB0139]|uniref:LysR substrate-binding domain-containing protein n=1 Tax=Xanthobacter sp. TB0139 TaxID=3459178 RepID=UPI0040391156